MFNATGVTFIPSQWPVITFPRPVALCDSSPLLPGSGCPVGSRHRVQKALTQRRSGEREGGGGGVRQPGCPDRPVAVASRHPPREDRHVTHQYTDRKPVRIEILTLETEFHIIYNVYNVQRNLAETRTVSPSSPPRDPNAEPPQIKI